MGVGKPHAYAKIATRGDVLPTFYIMEEHIKETDHIGAPTRIENVPGRCLPSDLRAKSLAAENT